MVRIRRFGFGLIPMTLMGVIGCVALPTKVQDAAETVVTPVISSNVKVNVVSAEKAKPKTPEKTPIPPNFQKTPVPTSQTDTTGNTGNTGNTGGTTGTGGTGNTGGTTTDNTNNTDGAGTQTASDLIIESNFKTESYVGAGVGAYTEDRAAAAVLGNNPNGAGLAIEPGGRLFFADAANTRLRSTKLNDPVTKQELANISPNGIAYDEDRKVVYIADTANNCIRRLALAGNTLGLTAGAVDVIAGTAGTTAGAYKDDADNGKNATFNAPTSLLLAYEVLYVADTGNHTIRTVDITDTDYPVRFLAGGKGTKGKPASVTTADTLSAARFDAPHGLATGDINNESFLFVADTNNHCIRAINLDTEAEVKVYAGKSMAAGTKDGDLITAEFNKPIALAADDLGNLYVGEQGNFRIRRVETNPIKVVTVAGAKTAGNATGDASIASFGSIVGLALELDEEDGMPKVIWGYDSGGGGGKPRIVKLSSK